MSNKDKSLADRILAIQEYCDDTHQTLEFFFAQGHWHAALDDVDEGDPSDTFEGMVEMLEAALEL